jgi:hypothetical protein
MNSLQAYSGGSTVIKAWVCGRSLAGIACLNATGSVDVRLLWVSCCQVEAPATDRSLVQTTPTTCVGVIECDQVQNVTLYTHNE